jgi:hypothetical protein
MRVIYLYEKILSVSSNFNDCYCWNTYKVINVTRETNRILETKEDTMHDVELEQSLLVVKRLCNS